MDERSEALEFDYVIVGAGSAGCVLASRLTEDADTTVLVLEAGNPDTWRAIHDPNSYYDLKASNVDWQFVTEPQAQLWGRKINWPRGKTLGGSSAINAMLYIRGNKADYDEWVSLGNPGWGYEDVLGFFKKSENNERGPSEYHGVGGPLSVINLPNPNVAAYAFIEAAVALGYEGNPSYDFNGAKQIDGAGFYQFTVFPIDLRASTASTFLALAAGRTNLTFLTDAFATRLVLEGKHVVGVEYLSSGCVRKVRARREVLVCAGAIQSPQLLMVSGIGPRAELEAHSIHVVAHLPGVGRNLQDHPVVWPEYQCNKQLSPTFGAGVLAGLFLNTRNRGSSIPDLQYHFQTEQIDEDEFGFSFGATLVEPRSVGCLGLRSANPADPPLINPKYLSDGTDLEVLVQGVKLAREMVKTAPFQALGVKELSPGPAVETNSQLREYVRRYMTTLYHPVGTCKMGNDDDAVVDCSLRVHGVTGLRVVDASIMPKVTRGNTNAPTIMIAEKLAASLQPERAIEAMAPKKAARRFRHP